MEHEEIPSLLSLDYHHHSFSSCITIYTIQQLTYWINYYKNNTSVTIQPVYLARTTSTYTLFSQAASTMRLSLFFSIHTFFFSLLSLIRGREVRREREGEKQRDKWIHHLQKTLSSTMVSIRTIIIRRHYPLQRSA